MTTLIAFEIDSDHGDSYWEVMDSEFPLDPPVVTIEGEDFGDYIADMLLSRFVDDILINTYESWLVDQELLDHKEYL